MTTTTPTARQYKKFGSNITEHHIAVLDALKEREKCSQGEALRRIIDHAEKTLEIKVKKVR